MNAYVRIVSALSKLGGLMAMALLAAAVIIVCQMIFLRYVLSASTIWQTEFVIYSLMAATFIGSARVLTLKGHVGVDLLPSILPPRPRFWLELVAGLFSLAFCALLAWSGWIFFEEAWSNGWTTDTVWAPPLWILVLPLPAGIGLLCLQYVAELIKLHQDMNS
jgi:TRAP-type C4-dicarboxylate transport system permease small subunit